jgi:hypothetical protein
VKVAISLLGLLAALPDALGDEVKPRVGRLPAGCEFVMSPGMRITATTSVGTITITAVDELTRSYTWDGATRAIEMTPRDSRWYGSLGLFSPGAGEHWRDHHGITRCVTAEGQQHFKTVEEALGWIRKRDWTPFVYRDDGLMAGWDKNFARRQLGVEVWQILIDAKKPKSLPGSQNDKLVVKIVETETAPLVKAVGRNDLNAVIALLAEGADANVKNSVQFPVLVMAIRRRSAPIVGALLKNGADPNIRDVDTDLTALWEAFDLEAPDRIEILKMLLAAGADVNAASRKEEDLLKGMTPLMMAAEDACEDLVQLFLDKGANVNAKARSGITALSLAKQSGAEANKVVISKLQAAGAKE